MIAAAVTSGALLALVLVWFQNGSSTAPPTADSTAPPASAVEAAQDLVSGDNALAAAALSPALAELLRASAIAPPGSTLELEPGSWSQRDEYAAAIGQLTVADEPGRRMFVGFVLRDGRWRITALEPTP